MLSKHDHHARVEGGWYSRRKTYESSAGATKIAERETFVLRRGNAEKRDNTPAPNKTVQRGDYLPSVVWATTLMLQTENQKAHWLFEMCMGSHGMPSIHAQRLREESPGTTSNIFKAVTTCIFLILVIEKGFFLTALLYIED